MISILKAILIVIFVLGSVIASVADDDPSTVVDHQLENRLKVVNTYKTRKNDTLRGVAAFLYGHRSWWSRLRQGNKEIIKFGPDQVLVPGTLLKYKAPWVGSNYVVQPNDWLLRIVQWRYGERDFWEEIYKKNKTNIDNPNRIHPGDRLILEENGNIRDMTSGETLVQGVQAVSEKKAVQMKELPSSMDMPLVENSPSFATPVASLSPLEPEVSRSNTVVANTNVDDTDELWNWIFWILLILLLVSIPLGGLYLLHRRRKYLKINEVASIQVNDHSLSNILFVHRDKGNVEMRPSYFSISKNVKKKPL